MPGRFQLLDKDKPTILLDNASNVDALKNILLGVRLLHYQRPLKGLSIILGLPRFQNLNLKKYCVFYVISLKDFRPSYCVPCRSFTRSQIRRIV